MAILLNNISNAVINTNMIITKFAMGNSSSNLERFNIGLKDDG